MQKNTKNQGFTLVELLIVIAIIGILAAVLIPNLLGSRAQAFDTGALNCGNAIQTAQTNYNGKYFEFADEFADLNEDLVTACTGAGVQLRADTTAPTTADSDGDVIANGTFTHPRGVSPNESQESYEIYIWDHRGSTYYLVNEETVQAAGEF